MKINITITEDGDNQQIQTMAIDGKKRLCVFPLCECPEDAIIGRALVSCKAVSSFMMEAYNAGKNGDEFTVEVSGIPEAAGRGEGER